jgi:hypothetical protein
MFPSTCGFLPQFYHSHPDLRHPTASLHSQHQPGHLFCNSGYGFIGQQSYDALYRQQPQPMTSIPAADSSRPFTISLTSDEQKCILRRMRKMRLISDRTTKELSQHHVQLLNTAFANIKQRLDCFNENTPKKFRKALERLKICVAASGEARQNKC